MCVCVQEQQQRAPRPSLPLAAPGRGGERRREEGGGSAASASVAPGDSVSVTAGRGRAAARTFPSRAFSHFHEEGTKAKRARGRRKAPREAESRGSLTATRPRAGRLAALLRRPPPRRRVENPGSSVPLRLPERGGHRRHDEK